MTNFALSLASVRSLKNALQDRFPLVKSAHLSEAIAATAGFRTHAALLAYTQKHATAMPIVFLDHKPFIERLRELGYPGVKPFNFSSVWLGGLSVPDQFRELVARVLNIEENPEGRHNLISALHRQCAHMFAKEFGLGYLESIERDKECIKYLTRGVDHKACRSGWGNVVNANHPLLDFPGTDHPFRFCERLPLSNGKYVEYSSAMVSMPYKGSFRIPDLSVARELAEQVGWQYAEMPEWTWYSAHATTLILYRRTTTHSEMLASWSTSFKRWVFENKSRLLKGASADRRHVIEDVLHCQHLPLDVQSWEELRERYFKEFVPAMYHFQEQPMARAFKRVFDKWLAERSPQGAS
jgi:hypothetical protein